MTKTADALKCRCFVAAGARHRPLHAGGEWDATSHAVTQHPGTRHHLDRGAPGVALLSGLTQQQREDLTGLELSDKVHTQLRQAEADGYATSHDEVIPGVGSVAGPR